MDYSTKGYHGTLADTAKSVIKEISIVICIDELILTQKLSAIHFPETMNHIQ